MNYLFSLWLINRGNLQISKTELDIWNHSRQGSAEIIQKLFRYNSGNAV